MAKKKRKSTARTKGYEKKYSDKSYWSKIKNYAAAAGYRVVEKAMILYCGLKCPKTPKWAKTAIIGALGYFISPLDAIPDITPVIGFSDDYGVLIAATAAVAASLCKKDVREGKRLTKKWLG